MKILQICFPFLPYILVFLASIYQPYDADIGWHLKYGEYFFKNGHVLRDNIFTAEMANYHWANASWAIDVVNYVVFNSFGFLGLSLLGATVVTLTFFFLSRAFKLSYWEKALVFPFLLYFMNPLNSVSFRGSLVSLLFISVLFYLLNSYERGKSKNIYFAPVLFLFWANLHGLFILGLGVYFLWTTLYVFQKYFLEKKFRLYEYQEVRKLVALCFISIGVTFIHPFGFEVYKDVLKHLTDPYLKSVAEYLPFQELTTGWWNHLIFGIIILFGIFSQMMRDEFRKHIPQNGIMVVLYALSLSVRRYAWATYYSTTPILASYATFFEPKKKNQSFIIATCLYLILIGFVIYIKLPISNYTNMNWDVYCARYMHCSPGGAVYLQTHKLEGKLLTAYDFGGYLIWNHPEIKPTIDGRMHVWRDEKGYSAFESYYPIEQNLEDIQGTDYKIVFMSNRKNLYNRLVELSQDGVWRQVYNDDKAGIFVRN